MTIWLILYMVFVLAAIIFLFVLEFKYPSDGTKKMISNVKKYLRKKIKKLLKFIN